MNIFEKKFAMLLEQPELPGPVEEPPVAPVGPIGGEDDTIVSPEVVDDVGDNPSLSWRKQANSKQRQTIQEWLGRIEEFNAFLNGLEGGSMQSQLNNADCDTLFNDVSRSETKKISRIAQDLSALGESLKGYILSAEE